MINRGISGDFTEGVLRRLEEVISLRPAKIFIEIGINDIIEKVALEEIARNYEAIVQQLLKECPGIRIFIQSNLPVCIKGSSLTSKAHINALIDEQNERLKELAAQYRLTYIDLHGHFQKNGELDMRLTTDGLHLNDEGYAIWKKVVEPYLQ